MVALSNWHPCTFDKPYHPDTIVKLIGSLWQYCHFDTVIVILILSFWQIVILTQSFWQSCHFDMVSDFLASRLHPRAQILIFPDLPEWGECGWCGWWAVGVWYIPWWLCTLTGCYNDCCIQATPCYSDMVPVCPVSLWHGFLRALLS